MLIRDDVNSSKMNIDCSCIGYRITKFALQYFWNPCLGILQTNLVFNIDTDNEQPGWHEYIGLLPAKIKPFEFWLSNSQHNQAPGAIVSITRHWEIRILPLHYVWELK